MSHNNSWSVASFVISRQKFSPSWCLFFLQKISPLIVHCLYRNRFVFFFVLLSVGMSLFWANRLCLWRFRLARYLLRSLSWRPSLSVTSRYSTWEFPTLSVTSRSQCMKPWRGEHVWWWRIPMWSLGFGVSLYTLRHHIVFCSRLESIERGDRNWRWNMFFVWWFYYIQIHVLYGSIIYRHISDAFQSDNKESQALW